jgi:hypothetical protein
MPHERYRLVCTRSPACRVAESHTSLEGLLTALADHRGRDWDAILITPLVTEPLPPQLTLWKEEPYAHTLRQESVCHGSIAQQTI